MFNFEYLDVQKDTDNTYNSFVGIKKSTETNKMTFFLPKGFSDFQINYSNVKNLFFCMYKTFKRFEIDNMSKFDKMLDKEGQNRDNTYSRDSRGYRFSSEDDDNEVLFYSKIDIIDNFFKVHQELDIDSIVQKFGYTENVDYSNIENLLNEGVILKNHAIFINDSWGEKSIIESSISELVELYCYIYKELLIELDSDISNVVSEVANNFSNKHLTSLQSLFNEDTYEITIMILKDCLDSIDKSTAYKDYLYHDIYEVIEQFLYGQLSSYDNGGYFWGINNFSYIWEDMCNSYMLSDNSRRILYCDSSLESENIFFIHKKLTRKKFGRHIVYIDEDFNNNFHVEMDGHKRWMRPDIVFMNINSSSFVDSLIDRGLLSLTLEDLNHKLLGNIGKVNISLKMKGVSNSSKDNFVNTKDIFEYFKYEFSNLKRTGHPLYYKAKGHQFIEVTDRFIKLNNVSREVFNEIYNKKNTSEKDENTYLVDWKYVPHEFFSKNTKKLRIDMIKQMTYEFCIMQDGYTKNKIINQFCIPKFHDSNNLVVEKDKTTIVESDIQIVSLNFSLLQREYVSRDSSLT